MCVCVCVCVCASHCQDPVVVYNKQLSECIILQLSAHSKSIDDPTQAFTTINKSPV